jgi:ATP-dependent protease ClpP protease subunit
MEMKKFWEIKNVVENESADIFIYNEIMSWDYEDVTSASSFKRDLDRLGKVKNLNIMINSPGGSVGDGLTIASLLQRHPANVTAYVDGMACSIASVIACAADKMVMGRSSLLMVHDASTLCMGNSKDLRKMADDLDTITASLRQMYLNKAGDKLTEEKITELMDKESWLSAKECMKLGLCDEILESNKMVAKLPNKFMNMYNNIPKSLLNQCEVKDMEESKIVESTEEVVEETVGTVEVTEEVVEAKAEEVETTESEVSSKCEECGCEHSDEEGCTKESVEETIVDERDAKIEELENAIKTLQEEKSSLEDKLNEANEKVIALNDKVAEMTPVVEEYNNRLAKEEEEKNTELLNEKREYYKNKFEQLGARSKFESEEVQNLISNCIKDEKSMSELNLMIVDMISVENSKPKEKFEKVVEMDNLLEIEETVMSKYGFR